MFLHSTLDSDLMHPNVKIRHFKTLLIGKRGWKTSATLLKLHLK